VFVPTASPADNSIALRPSRCLQPDLVLKCLKPESLPPAVDSDEQQRLKSWSCIVLLALAEAETNRRDQARMTRALSRRELPYGSR